METRDDILKELNEIAPKLASLQRVNAYKVPENYFVEFKEGMLEKVGLHLATDELKSIAPQLATIKKEAVAEVPAAYFTNFSADLLKKIRANEAAHELAEVAPTLSKLEKVYGAPVPANYFSTFPEKMLQQVAAQKRAVTPASPAWLRLLNEVLDNILVVVFKPKYSVAFAGVATCMLVAAMLFVKFGQPTDALDKQLAQLSTSEINAYLDNRPDAYTDEVFEMNGEEKNGSAEKISTSQAYKEALSDVDDAALDAAIAD